jgi:hypothetical protein
MKYRRTIVALMDAITIAAAVLNGPRCTLVITTVSTVSTSRLSRTIICDLYEDI